jgi:hypothetical protein
VILVKKIKNFQKVFIYLFSFVLEIGGNVEQIANIGITWRLKSQ